MDAAKPSDKRRIWLRRFLIWTAGALLAFELIYVIAANVILRTRSLDSWVTGATEGLFLKIESGWTLWPGRVHVKGAELRFEDYNVQFLVSLDEGTIDIALWQLPGKVFHLTRVRASGVRYLFRHKVESAQGLERRLALYPKIPGYADPPLFVGENTPPLTDEEYDLWTIHIEDVDATAKELWFLEYRFTGVARATGAFRLEPERDAQTELCKLTLDGRLETGEQTVASQLRGWLHAKLDRHDPRKVEGGQIFPKISINTKLDAQLPDLKFTELYRSQGGVELSDGTGKVHVRAQIEHGAWMDNTMIRYETDRIGVAQAPVRVVGPLVLEASIVEGGRDASMELEATSPRLQLVERDAAQKREPPTARAVRLVLGTSANLAEAIELRSMKAQLKLELPQLAWLNTALDSEHLFLHGSGGADVDLRWSKGELGGGTLALTTRQARFGLADNVLQVSGTANAKLSYDGETKRGQVNELEVDLPQVAVLHDERWKPLPGGLTARSERFTWQGEPPRNVQGRFKLEAKSIEPFLPFVISSSILRNIAKWLTDLGDTHAVVELERTPLALELRLEELRSGTLRVFGTLRSERSSPHPCGRFYVDDPKLGVGITLFGGETSIDIMASPKWWRERPPTTSCRPLASPVMLMAR